MPLKAAVIGAGAISEQHLAFLSGRKDVRVVAVCDRSRAMANFACERFGGARSFTDHRRMLDTAAPDVAHVLTPPASHVAIARDCLAAGAHVICEKPVALRRSEFHDLWQAAQRRGRILVEDHNYRFNAPWQAIERAVGRGELGEIEEVEVRIALALRAPGSRFADRNLPHPCHSLPAGVIHEYITHMTSLGLRFLPWDERGQVACAVWRNRGGDDLFKYDDLDATVLCRGRPLRLRFSGRTRPEAFTIFVRGDRGYAETDLYQPYVRVVRQRPGAIELTPILNHLTNGASLAWAGVRNAGRKLVQQSALEGLQRFLTLTYQAIVDDRAPPVSFDDIDRSLGLIERLTAELPAA
jgi:predicted dehydrogenase